MSKVEEIERAVAELPLEDLAKLAVRIDQRRWELGKEAGLMAARTTALF